MLFSHGWPLSTDSWEAQLLFLAGNSYRCIAHDRRGHGHSSHLWNGNDMDTCADDLSELIETLDLKDAVLIGFSASGGEVARSAFLLPAPGATPIRQAVHPAAAAPARDTR